MYIVIMGGGRVGLSLADRLIIHGYDVTIIESNDDLCDQASEELDAMVICGSGTDTKTLEEANIEEADVFVATTGNDESNLVTSLFAWSCGVRRIITKVSSISYTSMLHNVKIDSTVSPYSIILSSAIVFLISFSISSFVFLSFSLTFSIIS